MRDLDKDEQSDIKDYIGWLAPNGTHFSCDRYGHDALSKELLGDYCKVNTNGIKLSTCDDMLIDMGWCRIGFSTFLSYGYSIQAKWNKITESQKSFIKDMYFKIGNRMSEDTINNLKDYEIIDLYQESKQTNSPIKQLKK